MHKKYHTGHGCIALNWIMFIHASGLFTGGLRTEVFYDLTGSVTYLSTMLYALYHTQVVKKRNLTKRQKILALFVCTWCIRLGSFLFSRIHASGGIDTRFNKIKPNLMNFFTMWTVQGLFASNHVQPTTFLFYIYKNIF